MRASVNPDRATNEPSAGPENDLHAPIHEARGTPSVAPPGVRIAERFVVESELGRGGMAIVYQVREVASGQRFALKQLTATAEPRKRKEAAALFEREWHTLMELSHPHVIKVLDFGIAEDGPFYTMELLDGGDLRELSPMPWQRVCSIAFDVCSSLALLHSRRLVHRDVTPRNIRCTREGAAKLIDFGAMAPMGASAQIVGTPAFVAPEVVARAQLDARTDLYSLGASLYYALTHRPAHPARDFSSLDFTRRPDPPSHLQPGVPAALDALVLSLLSAEPEARPRSAFDVMQRLSAISGRVHEESSAVASAYLATPLLVGRGRRLRVTRARAQRAAGGSGTAIAIRAAAGMGRSRMLDHALLDAKALGATVLRTRPESATSSAALVQALIEQLASALPDAFAAAVGAERAELELYEARPDGEAHTAERALRAVTDNRLCTQCVQVALCDVIARVAEQRFLVIAIDDVQRCDEPMAALLAGLSDRASQRRLLLLLTSQLGALPASSDAQRVLASRSRAVHLHALSEPQTLQLVTSVFGDVPNAALLVRHLHERCAGNPREIMHVLRHLVEQGDVRYASGFWTLPAIFDTASWPRSSDATYLERVDQLSQHARTLLECQALASHDVFTRADYAALGASFDAQTLERALSELSALELLATDGHSYWIARSATRRAILGDLDDARRVQRHVELARLYQGSARPPLYSVDHLLRSGQSARALDELLLITSRSADREVLASTNAPMSSEDIAGVLDRAASAAADISRSARELEELRHSLVMFSAVASEKYYHRHAPAWFDCLARDSGLAIWRALADVTDPGERLTRALQSADARHQALPERERVYRVDEAIKFLVHYVVASIVVGARALDGELLGSLPAVLEPFTAFSPLIDAIRKNAVATREALCLCRTERARELWTGVLAQLDHASGTDLEYTGIIRNAIAYGVGALEARLGLASSERFVAMLDQDRYQSVSALHLRRISALLRGDAQGAELFRKKAELLAVQGNGRQMFSNTMSVELAAYVLSGDLTGVKHTADRIAPLARSSDGWTATLHLAHGQFERIRGQHARAREHLERCIALSAPDPSAPARCMLAWPAAAAAYVETLEAIGEPREALAYGKAALATCTEREIGISAHEIHRALAMVEAKHDELAVAIARLDHVISEQVALGVEGLHLGASYEARTRIAIWAGDAEAAERYGKLCAHAYRHGTRSALGARYERLMEEARRSAVVALPALHDSHTTIAMTTGFVHQARAVVRVAEQLTKATGMAGRLQCALRLLCEDTAAQAGTLYVVRDGVLVAMAVQGGGVAPDEHIEIANERLALEVMREGDETALATSGPDGSGSVCFTDASGRRCMTALLACTIDRVLHHVGVAALFLDDASSGHPPTASVTSAIATHLLRAGDAQSITAKDG